MRAKKTVSLVMLKGWGGERGGVDSQRHALM